MFPLQSIYVFSCRKDTKIVQRTSNAVRPWNYINRVQFLCCYDLTVFFKYPRILCTFFVFLDTLLWELEVVYDKNCSNYFPKWLCWDHSLQKVFGLKIAIINVHNFVRLLILAICNIILADKDLVVAFVNFCLTLRWNNIWCHRQTSRS